MLQSRAISEASFTFVSIREFRPLWLSIERAFKCKGLYFDFVYIMAEAMADMLHDVMVTAGNVIQHHIRSRCATT